MDLRKIFHVDIGHDAEAGVYEAQVISTNENKGFAVQCASLKAVLAEVSKKIRKRQSHNLRFPLPEPEAPSAIIHPNGNGAGKLIFPGRS